ncbi:tetratricopeptide repeat protein [Geminicoccus flavidas]|uniref:tetratricopeptide repeat protein n=1 Tax=Geminicoccus flavidas TaxID=2506407 RepID=UPI00135914AE|nr:tetratricopeptide repeat protein [Geminicoccus flavidas]
MSRAVLALLALVALAACAGQPAPRVAATAAPSVPAAELARARALADDGERDQALAVYAALASSGDPLVLYEYARVLEDGPEATPGDRQRALDLYRQASTQNLIDAQLRLANLLYLGEGGVPRNLVEAARYYDQAHKLIEPRADEGDAQAQEWMGDLYREGRGVPQNGDFAVYWYTQSAQAGRVSSYVKLARMFERGEAGVAVDVEQALRYYELAGQNDDAQSLFNIAKRYADGDGVTVDKVRAVELFERAARLGDSRAYARLGDLYSDTSAWPTEPAQAAVWYERAAAVGDEKSMYKLADLHDRGRLGARDAVSAYRWYLLAARNGHPKAPERLDRLTNVLSPTQREQAQVAADQWAQQLQPEAPPST